MTPSYYRTIYLSPRKAEDLAILRALLALPRELQSEAIKRALAEGLPKALEAEPLTDEQVRALIGKRSTKPRVYVSNGGREQRHDSVPITVAAPITPCEVENPETCTDTPTAADQDVFAAKIDALIKGQWIR
jgi:hypothetical protein